MTQNRRDEKPSDPPSRNPDGLLTDDDVLTPEAEDAVIRMENNERRRDDTYRGGGDDLSPGIDTDLNSNGPKEQVKRNS